MQILMACAKIQDGLQKYETILAEVLAKTKGGEHLWRAFQVH